MGTLSEAARCRREELRAGAVSLRLVLRKHARDDLVELERDLSSDPARRERFIVQVGAERGADGLTMERRRSHEALVEHAAECVYVGRGVDWLPSICSGAM